MLSLNPVAKISYSQAALERLGLRFHDCRAALIQRFLQPVYFVAALVNIRSRPSSISRLSNCRPVSVSWDMDGELAIPRKLLFAVQQVNPVLLVSVAVGEAETGSDLVVIIGRLTQSHRESPQRRLLGSRFLTSNTPSSPRSPSGLHPALSIVGWNTKPTGIKVIAAGWPVHRTAACWRRLVLADCQPSR